MNLSLYFHLRARFMPALDAIQCARMALVLGHVRLFDEV
ncbi:hypothetical protein C7402_105165 [Paraburkholderia unamae]|uniref:Uncharacterized protein n=1 Tax=Paraburkholderia unamae TaxID=219649 RepID=A0ABX5KRN4_9BURK|nr:hypothetical protein C7402_105165 [Paraburkholderia unamae]